MLFPEIDKMIEKVGSKYLLVTAAAKRARQLKDGASLTINNATAHKEVGKALEEIVSGTIVLEDAKDEGDYKQE
mgnify:CR=1 FL=1